MSVNFEFEDWDCYEDLIIFRKIDVIYENHKDRRKYQKLIRKLVSHMSDSDNRCENTVVQKSEMTTDGCKRTLYIDARTLYVISIKVDIFVENHQKNGYFIYTSLNRQRFQQDYINYFVV